ncbi:MAG: hypothetical protein WC803_02525 [Sphingomonas sp.]
MTMLARLTIVSLLALSLAGCGKGGGTAPTGQVVATVKGQEITTTELGLELGGLGGAGTAAGPQRDAALQAIITRKLLAAAARDRGMDKLPIAAVLEQKARELALVELLRMKLQSGAPAVSDDEARVYIAAHPVSFSQRQLIDVDQLVVPVAPKNIVAAMEPLNTMAEMLNLLDSNKVPYRRSGSVLDTAALDPNAAAQVVKVGVGKVFIAPRGGGVEVSLIRDMRAQPLADADALATAKAIIGGQRASGLANQAAEDILKAGKGDVKINPAFAPKTPPAGTGPKATGAAG